MEKGANKCSVSQYTVQKTINFTKKIYFYFNGLYLKRTLFLFLKINPKINNLYIIS